MRVEIQVVASDESCETFSVKGPPESIGKMIDKLLELAKSSVEKAIENGSFEPGVEDEDK